MSHVCHEDPERGGRGVVFWVRPGGPGEPGEPGWAGGSGEVAGRQGWLGGME